MSEASDDLLDQFTKPSTDKERIESLEREIEKLKSLIVKMVVVDESFETPYEPREIVQMLFNWANGD